MSRKFYNGYDNEHEATYETSPDTKTDPYQFTPTGLLYAQSMEAGARAKIAKMDNYLYAENEDVESDDISPIGVYPPDIAEAYQAVRFYKGKVEDARKTYEKSLKVNEGISSDASQNGTETN